MPAYTVIICHQVHKGLNVTAETEEAALELALEHLDAETGGFTSAQPSFEYVQPNRPLRPCLLPASPRR